MNLRAWVDAVGELRGSSPEHRASHLARLEGMPLAVRGVAVEAAGRSSRPASPSSRTTARALRHRDHERGERRQGTRAPWSPRCCARRARSGRASLPAGRQRATSPRRALPPVRVRGALSVLVSRARRRAALTEDDITEAARALGRPVPKKARGLATRSRAPAAAWPRPSPASRSAAVVRPRFVTYSNEAKREMLGVRQTRSSAFGAVSEEVAREMARGALRRSPADVSVAITGIAGPTGGSRRSPWARLVRLGGARPLVQARRLPLRRRPRSRSRSVRSRCNSRA
jgi:hypothetical protein